MKTAQQAAANWSASSGRAATAYQQGVEGYSGDWAGATVAQEGALLNNFQQAVTSGRWRQAVSAAGTGKWKSNTVAKIGNYSTGFNAGSAAFTTAIGKVIAAEANIVSSLPPRGDINANIARMTAFVQNMHALKGQLGS